MNIKDLNSKFNRNVHSLKESVSVVFNVFNINTLWSSGQDDFVCCSSKSLLKNPDPWDRERKPEAQYLLLLQSSEIAVISLKATSKGESQKVF